MLKKFLLTLMLGLMILPEVHAQIRTYSNEFLALGVGARGLAMGNTQVASVNDVTSAYWNPAGLNSLESAQLGYMHAEWFAGISKYDYAGLAMPIQGGKRALGLSLIRFGVDDIPNTLEIVDGDNNINYDKLKTFSAADYAFLVSIAQRYKKFDLGVNVKVIHRRVGTFANAWGFGLDVGAKYRIKDNLNIGLTIKDLTTTFNAWSYNFTEQEKLALDATGNVIPINSVELTGQRIVLGIAHDWQISKKLSLLSALDFDMTIDGERNVLIKADPISLDPHLGLELAYDRFVFLRFGLNNIQRFKELDDPSEEYLSIQPNLGVGLKIKNWTIDYAFTGLNNIDEGFYSHVVSVLFTLNKKGAKSTSNNEESL